MPGGGGEAGFGEDVGADEAGNVAGVGVVLFVAGYVEVGFVEGEGFDEVGVPPEDTVYLLGDLAVEGELRRYEYGLGAAAAGGGGGHGRVQAEAAGFVGGGADDGARSFPGDDEGLAAQFGAFAQFYGGVEGVHVDVDDFALLHVVGLGGFGFQTA